MIAPTEHIQITAHYLNGQTEAFQMPMDTDPTRSIQQLQQDIRRILEKDWWFFHLPDQTICIQRANVLKLEIKPAIPIHGEGVFSDAALVTPLRRAHHD